MCFVHLTSHCMAEVAQNLQQPFLMPAWSGGGALLLDATSSHSLSWEMYNRLVAEQCFWSKTPVQVHICVFHKATSIFLWRIGGWTAWALLLSLFPYAVNPVVSSIVWIKPLCFHHRLLWCERTVPASKPRPSWEGKSSAIWCDPSDPSISAIIRKHNMLHGHRVVKLFQLLNPVAETKSQVQGVSKSSSEWDVYGWLVEPQHLKAKLNA